MNRTVTVYQYSLQSYSEILAAEHARHERNRQRIPTPDLELYDMSVSRNPYNTSNYRQLDERADIMRTVFTKAITINDDMLK